MGILRATLLSAALLALAAPVASSHPGSTTPNLGASCDKASANGLKSAAHEHCIVDQIIDADGTATAGDGVPVAVDVQKGDALTVFPAGSASTGLDMFDQDGNAAWTQGVDDLHVEDPSVCPTALRNAVHDLGEDCKVLDLNGDLADGDPVDCDISVGVSFSGMPCPPVDVKFHDADGNGAWSLGEDIVQDVNGDGVYS